MLADSSLILSGSEATSHFPLLHAVVREHRPGDWEEGNIAFSPTPRIGVETVPRAK